MEIFRPFKIKCKFGILVKLTLGLLLFSLYFGLLLRESIHALKVGIHNRSTAEAAQLTRELVGLQKRGELTHCLTSVVLAEKNH